MAVLGKKQAVLRMKKAGSRMNWLDLGRNLGIVRTR